MQVLWEILVSWGPMFLLIGVWIYMARKSGGMKQGQYFDEVKVYLSEHLAETKQLNVNLERIANALERKNAESSNDGKDK
jgi:ATP-dependent Zn protease